MPEHDADPLSSPQSPARAVSHDLSASPRLFDNPLLDKLSRVPWWEPLALYLPVVAVLGWISLTKISAPLVLLAAIGGYLIWSFVEYLGHRWLFHLELPGRLGARLHFLIHGVHHVYPSDPLRLVMPPLLSLPIMLVAILVARFVFGSLWGYPVLMGFVIGYLGYDLAHYAIHHRTDGGRIFAALRRNHMLHHFRDGERGFGVSAPYWDHVFRTRHHDTQN